MHDIISSIKYYGKFSFFNIREENASLSSALSGFVLYPCFVWIFSKLWLGLNENSSTLEAPILFAYIGLTEILFLTALREPIMGRTSNDFSLSFVHPRLWSFSIFISIFSRTLYKRLMFLVLFLVLIPIFINDTSLTTHSGLRFFCLLPIITIMDSLYSFILTCIQMRFYTTKNFRMLFGKLLLIFGGVLAPLSDLSIFWRTILINTPFADLIFQPCYFSVNGYFYEISISTWFLRIIIQIVCLYITAYFIYRYSRQHYHNFGG